jgi:hypothetical protein
VFLAEIGLDEPPGRSQSDFMKLLLWVLSGLSILGASVQAAETLKTTDPQACRITAELRDGSRVVGASGEKYFRFHSPLLGDLKLAAQDVRSVECVSSNAAKLVTSRGDSLTVSFVDSSLPLKTAFGKVDLAVAQLRKLTVSVAGTGGMHRPGLVALWSGEGDGKNSAGSIDAELTEVTFADGKVGTAFSLENGTIKIPGNNSLNVGLGGGFTLCAWIKPTDVSKNNPIFEWVQDGFQGGTQFYIYPPHGGPGSLYVAMSDTDGCHYFSAPRVIVPNVFQHVAFTYDRASGMGRIFCNGTIVAQQHLGNFTAQTACNLYLGKRPLISGETYQFTGLLDQAAIYNRALSAAEIREICTEENNDELPPPPPTSPAAPMFRNGFMND